MDINPIEKGTEICDFLNKRQLKYEIHSSDSEEGYEYLEDGNICITVLNPFYEEKMYIDLEAYGEFTLSFNGWHSHYFGDEEEYQKLLDDLESLFSNKKCVLNIFSDDKWICSSLIDPTEEKSYKKVINSLKEFRKEIEKLHGEVKYYYWNCKDNKVIEL